MWGQRGFEQFGAWLRGKFGLWDMGDGSNLCMACLYLPQISVSTREEATALVVGLSLSALGSRFATKSLFSKCLHLTFPVCPVYLIALGQPHLLPSSRGPLRTCPVPPGDRLLSVTLKLSSVGCSQVRNLSNQLPLLL